MTTRTISATDIAALQAVRSVIADATGHPGQQAAVEAIDRLAAPEPDPATVIGDLLRQHYGSIGPLRPAAACETCGALHSAEDLDGGTRCRLCKFMDAARVVREGRYSIATRLEYGDRKRFDKFNEAFDRLESGKDQGDPVRSHDGYDGRLSDTSYVDVPRDASNPAGQRMAHVSWTSRDPRFDIKIPPDQDLHLSLRRSGSDAELSRWPLGLRDETDLSRRLFKLDVYAIHDSGHIMAPRASAVTEDAPAEMDTCDDFDCDD